MNSSLELTRTTSEGAAKWFNIGLLVINTYKKSNDIECKRERGTCGGGEGAGVVKRGEEGKLRGSNGGGDEDRGFGWEWGKKTVWYLWRAQMGEEGEKNAKKPSDLDS